MTSDELFRHLRDLRYELADSGKRRVPPYVVAPDWLLRDLATYRPRDFTEATAAAALTIPQTTQPYLADLLNAIPR